MDNKNIKGNISNNVIGAPKKVKKYGKRKLVPEFLKKEISSKILSIIIKLKKTKLIKKNFPKKFLIRYFS